MKYHELGGGQHKWLNNYSMPYQTEVDTVDYLLKNGIYAVNGKFTSWRYVDIVAFGCVAIENKYSNVRQDKGHSYGFRLVSKWHDNGMRGNIIILCAQRHDRVERTIWNVNDPIFYRRDGSPKQGIWYTTKKTQGHARRAEYGVSINPRLWREHIDRFDIIHDCLRNICTNMLTPENYHRYRLDFNNGNPAQEAEPVYTPIVQEQRQLSLL